MEGNSSARVVKEIQIEGSWAPMTPLKPIYEDGGETELLSHTFMRELDDHMSRFSHQQTQAQTLLSSSITTAENMNQSCNYNHFWDTPHNNNNNNNRPILETGNVGMPYWSSSSTSSQGNFPVFDSSWGFLTSNDNGVGGNNSVVDNGYDESLLGFNNMSFGDLLAMKGSLLGHGSTVPMRMGNSSGGSTMSEIFRGRFDCSSTFGGVNLQFDGFGRGEMEQSAFHNQDGTLCNVNSPLRTNYLNGSMFSFAPPTPDLQGRAENILTTGITNEPNNTEAMVGARDSQQDKGSIVIEENHNPDKVGEQGIDLNKTPAQKKPRRRRYTPKVVREDNPKKTPKSSTPKPPKDVTETAKVKRKYVRKNKMNPPPTPPPPPGEGTEAIDPKNNEPPVKTSCKRSLNFDLNEQETEHMPNGGIYAIPQPKESTVETSKVGVGCDLNRTLCQDPKNYGSQAVVDKVESSSERNSSPCASSNESVRMRGSKRGHYSSITDAIKGNLESVAANTHSTFWQTSPSSLGNANTDGVRGILFPEVHKKKRTDTVQISHLSNTPSAGASEDLSQASSTINSPRADLGASKYYYCNPVPYGGNASALNRAAILMRNAQNRAQLLNTWADMARLKKKKRTKGTTRVRDLSALKGIAPIAPAIPPAKWPRISYMNPPNGENSCIEALTDDANTTPRSKRGPKKITSSRGSNTGRENKHLDLVLYDGSQCARKKKGKTYSKNKVSGLTGSVRWISTFSLEAVTEGLKQLDINREGSAISCQEQSAIVPYQMNNREQNALVLYNQDGTMVPYEGPFEPRKRRQRAKVDLDDETTRVWRLLLENIDNQGIDGSDEDKVKWWDNERSVFRGRVDSFIARMRLVQGDRRFTPWKGSVLDSVIGVFLTQNVSDHLSSSAFMAMVSRFPLKSEHNESTLSEEATSALVVEPEESITWNEKALDLNEEKEVDYYCESSQKPMNNESRVDKANSPTTDTEGASVIGDDRARDDATSSQQSVISSQNSVSSPNFQALGIIGSSSETNSRPEALGTGLNCDYFDGATSFMGLLKMAESPLLHEPRSQIPGNIRKAFPEVPSSCSSDYQCFPQIDLHLQASKYIEMLEAESRASDMSRKDENSPTKESNLTETIVQDLGKEKALDGVPRSFTENLSSCYFLQGEQMVIHSKTQGQTSSIWKSTILPNSSPEADVTESTTGFDRTRNNRKEIQQVSKNGDANPTPSKPTNSRPGKAKKNAFDWDSLRREAQANGRIRERTANTRDSIDWERVRHTDVSEISDTIKARGMNNMLSERIKELLDRLVRDHGSVDLEWLRDIPPDKAKEYLLSFRGLGLKSVECVRLLTLHHLAFPVDTNVGRIAVRLGWVPLQPLPESLQLHLLEMYPILESIQKYLWPRLCKLDQKTLYELHYHMITFGKVFCTKRQPNCNACPLRGECRHFASAFASARLALPGPEERSLMAPNGGSSSHTHPQVNSNPLPLPTFWGNQHSEANSRCYSDASMVQVPSTPLSLPFPQTIQHLERRSVNQNCEPIVEVPASPEPEPELEPTFCDIEDAFYEDPDEIPTIELNMKEFTQTLENFMQANRELQEAGMTKALVALTPEAASIPTPKLKNISRLRTEHHVYELPDTHPLLKGLDKREPDDPCSYLLAIWTPGETANSIDPPERRCNFEDPNILCNEVTCAYCSSQREANSQIVRGTLLIPCRTAMRGSFPLNGTYFQVNEVFADHDSSLSPIDVPRNWLWNLPRRTVYFGTSIPTIFKGLNTEEIQHCFWRGYVCVRGFDQKTRAPRPLMARLHFPASRMQKGAKGKAYRDDE